MTEQKEKVSLFLKIEPEVKAALLHYVRNQAKEQGRHISMTEVFTQWVKSLQTSNH